MRLNKKDIINFNVDYIEVYWTLKNYKEILKWLDNDNSNFRNYKGFTIEKTDKLRNYVYKITFWKNNTPVFAWYEWATLNMFIETKDYFVVYWSAFNIFSLAEIIDFINENIRIDYWTQYYIKELNKKLKEKREIYHMLKRVDLAIDIIKPINLVIKNFKKLKSKWAKFYDDKWNIQTYYIWEKKNKLNKNLLIRIYDKIADIKQKEKQYLYTNYLKEKYITRIELEFRSEALKFLKLEQLLDRSYIFNLFTSYISKHTDIFSKLESDTPIKLKKLSKKLNLWDLHTSQIVKKRYLNTFLGYSNKLLELWTCPVDYLLREWILKENTKYDIWLSIDEEWKLNLSKYRFGVTSQNARYIFADNYKKDEWWD